MSAGVVLKGLGARYQIGSETVLGSHRTHLVAVPGVAAACGKIVGYWLTVTEDVSEATCRTCLKAAKSSLQDCEEMP